MELLGGNTPHGRSEGRTVPDGAAGGEGRSTGPSGAAGGEDGSSRAAGAPALCIELAHAVDALFGRLHRETEVLVEARMQRAQWEPSGAREQAARDAAELTRRARALGHAVHIVIDDLGRLYHVALRATGTMSLLDGRETGGRP